MTVTLSISSSPLFPRYDRAGRKLTSLSTRPKNPTNKQKRYNRDAEYIFLTSVPPDITVTLSISSSPLFPRYDRDAEYIFLTSVPPDMTVTPSISSSPLFPQIWPWRWVYLPHLCSPRYNRDAEYIFLTSVPQIWPWRRVYLPHLCSPRYDRDAEYIFLTSVPPDMTVTPWWP